MNQPPFPSIEVVAVSALGLVIVGLVAWFVRAWRATPFGFRDFCFDLINQCITRTLWRAKVSGPMQIAPDQGAIVVSNHRSGIDPLLIQLSVRRLLYWMVAKEYFSYWYTAWVLNRLPAIPVRRTGIDTAATKQAIRLAQQGNLVGLFPEGRINVTDELLLPGRPGAALIAIKARVPVVPCYVSGSPYDGTALGSFFMRANAKVFIGQPIDISAYYDRDDKEALQELTRIFLVEIARLAGVENYEPKMAGKNWMLDAEEANGNAANGNHVNANHNANAANNNGQLGEASQPSAPSERSGP